MFASDVRSSSRNRQPSDKRRHIERSSRSLKDGRQSLPWDFLVSTAAIWKVIQSVEATFFSVGCPENRAAFLMCGIFGILAHNARVPADVLEPATRFSESWAEVRPLSFFPGFPGLNLCPSCPLSCCYSLAPCS
jgi:hypothetical protein